MDVDRVASQLGLEPEDIYDVIALFIQIAPSDIRKLDTACRTRNAALAGEAAHSLKGSAGTLGFADTAARAQAIMAQSRENRVDDLTRSIPPFLDGLRELVLELRQLLDNRAARRPAPQ